MVYLDNVTYGIMPLQGYIFQMGKIMNPEWQIYIFLINIQNFSFFLSPPEREGHFPQLLPKFLHHLQGQLLPTSGTITYRKTHRKNCEESNVSTVAIVPSDTKAQHPWGKKGKAVLQIMLMACHPSTSGNVLENFSFGKPNLQQFLEEFPLHLENFH